MDELVIDSKYKEWDVADIGLSKDVFTMMYHPKNDKMIKNTVE